MNGVVFIVALSMTLSFVATPGAQEIDDSEPALASQQRLVAVYGFEEAGEFPTRLPAPFFRLLTRETGRPGFPQFGSVEVDTKVASEGDWSLRFDVDGSSIVVALPPAEIPIFPQSHYQIRAKVRTEGLTNAGASLAVRLHDIDGVAIPGTDRRSTSIRTHGEWTTLLVEPPMDVPGATDLVFELRVDQPSQDSIATGGRLDRPVQADIMGSAWFDEIEVWQLPRMLFSATPSSGTTRLPQRPTVEATLRDITIGTVSAVLRIKDVDGVVRQERTLVLDRGKSELSMDLGPLPPGWYMGELVVHDGDEVVASARQGLAILPERIPARLTQGTPRFGIAFNSRREVQQERDLDLLQLLRPGYVVIPVWEAGEPGELDVPNASRIDMILDAVHASRIEPVFEFAGVPSDAPDSEHLDEDQVMALLNSHESNWAELLEPWMAHYGDEVSRWRIKSEFDSGSASESVGSLLGVARFAQEFVASPTIELSFASGTEGEWSTHLPSGADARVMEIPGSVHPSEIGGWVRSSSSKNPVIHLAPGSSSPGSSPRVRAEETARRLVEAWAAGAAFIEIPAPWSTSEGAFGRLSGIAPTGVAFNQIASLLSGRPPEVEVPLGRGVRAILVGGRGAPMLVAWAAEAGATIDLAIGDGDLSIHEVLGDSYPVEDPSIRHAFPLGSTPVMIEGIDLDSTRFRAGARIEPKTIAATIGMHEIDLHLRNPWDETIDVRVRPIGPGSFRFQPRSRSVSIRPNEEVVVPFEFSYPRSQVDGAVDLRFETQVERAGVREITLLLPTDIESHMMDMEISWRRMYDSTGRLSGVLVTVRAYNIGAKPILLEAFSSAIGYAPMRKSMPEIQPGGSAARTFAFPGGDGQLRGREFLVGVSDIEGDGRIVRRVNITQDMGSLVEVDSSAGE